MILNDGFIANFLESASDIIFMSILMQVFEISVSLLFGPLCILSIFSIMVNCKPRSLQYETVVCRSPKVYLHRHEKVGSTREFRRFRRRVR